MGKKFNVKLQILNFGDFGCMFFKFGGKVLSVKSCWSIIQARFYLIKFLKRLKSTSELIALEPGPLNGSVHWPKAYFSGHVRCLLCHLKY